MSEYYIRTPEQDESRGPFTVSKLNTLAEAGQVKENTLYYDEDKEEWIPIALNEVLKAQVFPKSEKLKLNVGLKQDDEARAGEEEEEPINIHDMLKAAEGDTEETRHLKRSQESFEKAVALASMTLGVMMLLAAISFIVPHLGAIQGAFSEQFYAGILNYPFLLLGVFDLTMAILLLLSVTEIYPLVRGRSMLGLGFGLYVGWAIGDPLIMLAFGIGGAGIFLATIAQKFSLMILAVAMGTGGNGILAYLAINDRFIDFYSTIQFNLFSK